MAEKNTKSDSTVFGKSTAAPKTATLTASIAAKQSANVRDTDNDRAKESIECLHEAKPAPNLAINGATIDERNEEDASTTTMTSRIDGTRSNASGPAKIETVFEKLSTVSEQSETSHAATISDRKSEGKKSDPTTTTTKTTTDDEHVAEINNVRQSIDGDKQKIDTPPATSSSSSSSSRDSYGKLNKQRDMSSSVFPVGCMGCKDDGEERARRFIDAKEATQDYAGHIDATPRKRLASAKPSAGSGRNPLTGDGFEGEEEAAGGSRNANRKKDGNPVTGTGYEKNIEKARSSTKVPPGGYSHGLW